MSHPGRAGTGKPEIIVGSVFFLPHWQPRPEGLIYLLTLLIYLTYLPYCIPYSAGCQCLVSLSCFLFLVGHWAVLYLESLIDLLVVQAARTRSIRARNPRSPPPTPPPISSCRGSGVGVPPPGPICRGLTGSRIGPGGPPPPPPPAAGRFAGDRGSTPTPHHPRFATGQNRGNS